jgi:hypothetical protein
MKLKKAQKELIFKLRDFLRENKICIDARYVTLSNNNGFVYLDSIMTDSNYEEYEIAISMEKAMIPKSKKWIRTSSKNGNKIIKE